jgi:porphobilinogen deaminase
MRRSSRLLNASDRSASVLSPLPLELVLVNIFPCLTVDERARAALVSRSWRAALADPETELRLAAERAFLARLEGGCSIPSFGYASLGPEGVTLLAGIVSLDGKQEVRVQQTAPSSEAEALGLAVANMVLAQGGQEILEAIRRKG